MAATATVEFNGVKVSYDSSALGRWSVQRSLAMGGAPSYEAFDKVLLGKSDEVAEKFEDDANAMSELLVAILEQERLAKN